VKVSHTARLTLLAIAALAYAGADAEDTELERLRHELSVAAPPEQYPDHAEYRLFPKLCNERICFKVLAVRFVSHAGPVIRLAVFSEAEHYIGSYQGLKRMPTKAAGPILHFAATTRESTIRFDRNSPPAEIRIDGATHTFEPAR
jgi:hypothetical protein